MRWRPGRWDLADTARTGAAGGDPDQRGCAAAQRRASKGLREPALYRKMTRYPFARNCLQAFRCAIASVQRLRRLRTRRSDTAPAAKTGGAFQEMVSHSAEMAPLVPALKLSMKRTHLRSSGTVVPLRSRGRGQVLPG